MELRQSITSQVNKKSRVPEEEKGSGALKEEIRVSILKEGKRTNIFPIFLNLSHIKLFFSFFKPKADDYTTKQLSLNSVPMII